MKIFLVCWQRYCPSDQNLWKAQQQYTNLDVLVLLHLKGTASETNIISMWHMHFQLLCRLIVYSQGSEVNQRFIYVSSEQKTWQEINNPRCRKIVTYFPSVLPSIQKWLLKIICLQLWMQNNSDTHMEMTCRATMSDTVKG